jgi:hypothetical protein
MARSMQLAGRIVVADSRGFRAIPSLKRGSCRAHRACHATCTSWDESRMMHPSPVTLVTVVLITTTTTTVVGNALK